MTSIRRATPSDAPAVHGLVLELARHQDQEADVGVTVAGLQRLLARPDVTYLVAERDGRLIGYASWLERVSFWSGEDYLALDDVYVRAADRGRGVGERLMRAVADAAAGRLVRWEVAGTNTAAQRFYARLGAEVVTKRICRWRP
jgi:ribosomal protein S18 acetylase RimI-like enzyme